MAHAVLSQGHLETDAIPGTVHLVDLEGTLHAKKAGGNLNDVVLVPTPAKKQTCLGNVRRGRWSEHCAYAGRNRWGFCRNQMGSR